MPEFLPKELEEFRADLLDFLIDKVNLSSIELKDACLAKGIYKIPQPIEYGGSDAGPLKLAVCYETVASAGISNISDVIGPTRTLQKTIFIRCFGGTKQGRLRLLNLIHQIPL